MGDFIQFLQDSYLLDILDVFIVGFLFYRLYLIIRGTRAIQMLVGLAVLFAVSLLAENMGLLLLNRIIKGLQTVWLIAFIIIFQPELRAVLGYLGRTRYFRFLVREAHPEVVDEIVRTVERLAKKGLGAILVFQRNTGLKTYIDTGTRIGSSISAELLETIFTPPTPLHDGAVIIRGDRVVAAGCILPLSRNEHLAYTLGTRHRASLGITEETDAVVVVVSEENRAISVAQEGHLRRRLEIEELREELLRLYGHTPEEEELEDEIPDDVRAKRRRGPRLGEEERSPS